MDNSSDTPQTYSDKKDEEYFIYFYEEVLKAYLPPRYKTKSLNELSEADLLRVLDKWFRATVFNKNKVDNDSIKSKGDFHSLIKELLQAITYFQLENTKISKISTSHHYCTIIKVQLLKYNQEQCIKLLYYIKNFDSIETRSNTLFKKRKSIFINAEASDWFFRTLENKYDIKNGQIRGLNAFVNALINNSEVQNHILLKSCTQKKIVEYLNAFYNKELIKNHTRLSDPKKYIKEVNELIKEHLKSKRGRY